MESSNKVRKGEERERKNNEIFTATNENVALGDGGGGGSSEGM